MNQVQWLLLFLVSPIVVAFLVRCLSLVLDIIDANHIEPKIIEVVVEKEKIVYKDKPKKSNNDKISPIVQEVVSALKSLGIPKKEGLKLANSIYQNKTYNNAEDLLKDCMSSL